MFSARLIAKQENLTKRGLQLNLSESSYWQLKAEDQGRRDFPLVRTGSLAMPIRQFCEVKEKELFPPPQESLLCVMSDCWGFVAEKCFYVQIEVDVFILGEGLQSHLHSVPDGQILHHFNEEIQVEVELLLRDGATGVHGCYQISWFSANYIEKSESFLVQVTGIRILRDTRQVFQTKHILQNCL